MTVTVETSLRTETPVGFSVRHQQTASKTFLMARTAHLHSPRSIINDSRERTEYPGDRERIQKCGGKGKLKETSYWT